MKPIMMNLRLPPQSQLLDDIVSFKVINLLDISFSEAGMIGLDVAASGPGKKVLDVAVSKAGMNVIDVAVSEAGMTGLDLAVSGTGKKVLDVAVSKAGMIGLDDTAEYATVRLVLGDVTDFEVRPCKT
jgi:hypothetical protein